MQFTTPVDITHSAHEISYSDSILMLGSCFTENISEKLRQSFFRVTTNPFGILYNPASISSCLRFLASDREFDYEQYSLQHKGVYHSWLHHGSFSSADREQFVKGIQQSIEDGRRALRQASVVIVTFGTAWVYEHNSMIVANCHKLPADCFTRRRLQVKEIVTEWHSLLSLPLLRDKHFIFTVSPIRHIKDGLHQNQLSKATLLLACEQLADYFPSYEIVTDELRDYRFYADDMLHPSSVAVDYIWERFKDTYFSHETIEEMRPLCQLYSDLNHRPLHPDSPEYRTFREKTEEKTRALQKKYPWITES